VSLGLQPHPEGGWYRETWRSPVEVTLPDGRVRSAGTLIHFLLPAGESSAWHRVSSDELWIAQTGTVTLELGGADPTPATVASYAVGVDVAAGELPQVLVPAGVWQRTVPSPYDALVSCLVSPGLSCKAELPALPRQHTGAEVQVTPL
jgi:predicted cupin superfamily sugar epimerase